MKILVPVDFHKTSFSAFSYAANMASVFDADVTLIHVINGSFNTNEVVGFDPLLNMEEAARKRLKYFTEEHAKNLGVDLPSFSYDSVVRFGIPGFTISDYANEGDYDLVIMGTRDKHGFFDQLLGSVSAITLRQSKCPVLLVHQSTRFVVPEKIAFAFDDKSDLTDAIDEYLTFNEEFKAKTDFIHVNVKNKDDLSLQKADILGQLFKDNKPDFAFEIKAIEGRQIRSALKDYCLFEKVDMLVMVHRKEGIFTKVFRVNQSVQMAQEYHLPVLVFKEK